jgi:hypothetical protein|nr:hypothetical protein [Runella sp.]
MPATAFAAVTSLFVVDVRKYQKTRVFIHVIVFGIETGTLLKGNI